MNNNSNYWANLVKEYGNTKTGIEDKSQRFKTDFKIEELSIGSNVLNAKINTQSTILEIRYDNCILTLDKANKKNLDENRKTKGIDCKNWYSFEDFCRTFKRVK